ncbi:DUF2339 domain-containing protein [Flexithrix dorotheae]|uniref:DUF2339 domain-containing protein n=1 Tax=Flexithrix dorotheae TaxID=70993 RepID=UPI000361267A|nr:DUF2339 domain-containing protein [Flexithrix dorotheae]
MDHPEKNEEEENKKKDTPEEKEKDKGFDKEMDEFREELEKYRDSHRFSPPGYDRIENDIDYKKIYYAGDFTKNDIPIERFYPNASEIFKKRPPVVRDPDNDPTRWKMLRNEVYIKEFQEDDEVIKAQLAQMKKEKDKKSLVPHELSNKIGENFKEIQSELPIIKKDIERYIGEDLLTQVGILIILVAVSVLFKLGINKGYINETVRTIVGILLGGGFLTLAHFMVSRANKFTSILVTLGAAVFYYTIKLSFTDYFLLSQTQAFVGGSIVTLIILGLSATYKKSELSILGIFGGFLTPVLVSTGDGNFIVLLSYLLVLNIIVLVIAYINNWQLSFIISFVLSYAVLMAWYFKEDFTTTFLNIGLFSFSTLFYILFLAFIMAFNTMEHWKGKKTDTFLHILNTGIFLVLSVKALNYFGDTQYVPILLAVLGVLNFYYSLILYGRNENENSLYKLLQWGFILFIAVAVYLAFDKLYVNIWWAAQAVILLWIGNQTKSYILRGASSLVLGLSLIYMLKNWTNTYWSPQTQEIVFNSGFASGLSGIIALSCSILLLTTEEDKFDIFYFSREYYAKILGTVLMTIGLLIGFFELLWHTPDLEGGSALRWLMIDAYVMAYALVVRGIVHYLDIRALMLTAGRIVGFSILFYIVFCHSGTLDLRQQFLNGELPFYPFGFHYINLILSIILIYLLISDIAKSEGYASGMYSYILWFLCIVGIFYLSYELEHTFVLVIASFFDTKIDSILEQIRLTGLSVLWTVVSVLLMYFGIRYKLKELRVISLVLIAVTIVKFFLFDFRKLEPITQIASAVLIGLILLGVSKMYTKLRNLVNVGQLFDKDQQITQEQTAELMKALKKQQEEGEGE